MNEKNLSELSQKQINDLIEEIKSSKDEKKIFDILFSSQYEKVLLEKELKQFKNERYMNDIEKLEFKRKVKLFKTIDKLTKIADDRLQFLEII